MSLVTYHLPILSMCQLYNYNSLRKHTERVIRYYAGDSDTVIVLANWMPDRGAMNVEKQQTNSPINAFSSKQCL